MKKTTASISCPYCGHEKTYVVLVAKDEDCVLRQRRCDNPECGKRFCTIEMDADNDAYACKRLKYLTYKRQRSWKAAHSQTEGGDGLEQGDPRGD